MYVCMERNAWPYVSHQQKSGGQASSSFPEELQLVTRVRVGLDKEGVLPAVIPEPGGAGHEVLWLGMGF